VQIEDVATYIESYWIMGDEREGVVESNGRGWLTKVKYTHSRDTLRNPSEHLVINNKRQDCKIGTVYVLGGYLWEEGRWTKRWRWGNMVDGFHIRMWNRTMKPTYNCIKWKGVVGEDWGGDGRGWSNQCTMQAYSELSQWITPVQWIYPNKKFLKKEIVFNLKVSCSCFLPRKATLERCMSKDFQVLLVKICNNIEVMHFLVTKIYCALG
jgi:hypothetical protein